jgi:hypothetical protein
MTDGGESAGDRALLSRAVPSVTLAQFLFNCLYGAVVSDSHGPFTGLTLTHIGRLAHVYH